MVSPARRHFLRVAAGQAATAQAGAPASATVPAQPIQVRMQSRLAADEAGLKALRSVAAKVARKRELLPHYADYAAGVLAADAGGDDAIIIMVMVWYLDCGMWPEGMALAAYAIRHGLTTPQRFTRDTPSLVLELVAEAALAAIEDKTTTPALADALDQAMDLTDGADMPDEIRSKAEKAAGLLAMDGDAAKALTHLRYALTLHRGAGVKQHIARLEKQLGKQPGGTTA